MRTIVDLPDDAVAELDRLRAARGVSRAQLVREAVDAYLETQATSGRDAAFGAWGRGEDGLSVQRRLRSEWQER